MHTFAIPFNYMNESHRQNKKFADRELEKHPQQIKQKFNYFFPHQLLK